MNNIDRIKEVLNLETYYKKQKTEFRKRILSTVLAICLIIGAITFWYYYG
tara:strand:- start:930 stop:1079 length:150 start_codon:yes stop_codon:yes gene_type:complete